MAKKTWKAGDEIEILPNLMPDAERKRLESAVSYSPTTKRNSPSRVDQPQHQTESINGIIEEVRQGVDKTSYLVRVFLKGRPGGVLRVYPEVKAKFKAR